MHANIDDRFKWMGSRRINHLIGLSIGFMLMIFIAGCDPHKYMENKLADGSVRVACDTLWIVDWNLPSEKTRIEHVKLQLTKHSHDLTPLEVSKLRDLTDNFANCIRPLTVHDSKGPCSEEFLKSCEELITRFSIDNPVNVAPK